jgi:hypothetical protein
VGDGDDSVSLGDQEVATIEEVGNLRLVFVCDRGRWATQPDQLGVAVRQARAGELALVEEGVRLPFGSTAVPCRAHGLDVLVVELGEGADVLGGVNDDLLPLEGRVEVRHDTHEPRALSEPQHLRRSAILAAPAEWTPFELLVGRGLALRQPRPGPGRPSGCNHDAATRQRVFADLGQL